MESRDYQLSSNADKLSFYFPSLLANGLRTVKTETASAVRRNSSGFFSNQRKRNV